MISEAKAPQPGEWWVDDETGCKCYFIGRTPKGEMVWQVEFDNNVEVGDIEWAGWHHAPWCTSWESVEPKEQWPKYYKHRLSFADKTAYVRRDSERTYRCVRPDATESEAMPWREPHVMAGHYGYWKEITKAEADALLTPKPIESPDDWVTQDRVPKRDCDQWRWSHWNKDAWERADVIPALKVYGEMRHGAKTAIGESRQSVMELRCRRKDLPPIAEPSPPLSTPEPPIEQEAEREVYLYWYDGNVVGRYADCPPQDSSFTPLVFRDGRVFIQAEEVNRG